MSTCCVNIRSCGFLGDEECIRECRANFGEENLPDTCSLCNLNRPFLFVNREDIANSVDASIINKRLMYESVKCDPLHSNRGTEAVTMHASSVAVLYWN
jgi:hypothetical protein